MAVFVEVMYADRDVADEWRWAPDEGLGHRTRVPIAARATLATGGVLFVILSSPTTADLSRRVIDGAHYRRVGDQWGDDNYILTVTGDNFWLWGWDDKHFRFRTLTSPFVVSRVDTPPLFPPADSMNFQGVQIPIGEWNEALRVFNEGMH